MSGNPPATFDSLKTLLLELAEEHRVAELLQRIVKRLSDLPDAALARIWLTGSAEIDAERRQKDASPHLRLVASRGRSTRGVDWSGIAGEGAPCGEGLARQIAASGDPVEVSLMDSGTDFPGFEQEHLRGVIGQPLVFRGEVLGVLAVFLRASPPEDAIIWLRMVADHAAAALAGARAFEEIQRLRSQLEQENTYLREQVRAAQAFGEIVGQSLALRKVLEQVELVAPTEASVLILGESGTGKELIAQAIHEHSPRRGRPLITVNCASIPRELFESEFFGHLAGAFTGAIRDRAGRFELARGGTLFLDEVGEIPLEMQGKLLRVLQEQTFERIGEEKTRQADVRIIAATNRDLRSESAARRFRQDLYFRLSVFPIDVIPLRERIEDIPLLAAHFLELHYRRLGLPAQPLKRRHVQELQAYDWPGNVRELQNVIERAVIRSRTRPLQFDLPGTTAGRSDSRQTAVADTSSELLTEDQVRQLERRNLIAVLDSVGWKLSGAGGAAEFLGLHPATLASRLRAMRIERPRS